MSIDRILQLKLVADVSDIDAKMGQASSAVGRVGGAFATLKGFAGPVVLDAALTGITAIGDALGTGAAEARAYDDAVFGLGQTIGDLTEAEDVAAQLRELATAAGFSEDVDVIAGYRDNLIAMGGDADTAMAAIAAAFDVARTKGIEVDEALDIVREGIVEGGEETARVLGTSAETAEQRLADIQTAFGGAADAYAETAQGMKDVAESELGDLMSDLGAGVNDLADAALPVVLDLWGQLEPMLRTFATELGPVVVSAFESIWSVIERVATIIEKLMPAFQAAWEGIQPIVTLIQEHVGNVLGGIMGILDALILLLEGGSIEDAFKMAFDGIVRIVKTPVNLMLGAVEAGLNFLGDLFFDALEAIRSSLNQIAFVGDAIPDEPISWGGVSVPRLASGGIVTRPTVALIGEAGPEAVVPLGRGLAPVVNVYASAVSPADVGRAVVEAIQAYETRAGAAWRA